MNSALILLHMQNDLLDPNGGFIKAGAGYVDFAAKHGTIARVNEATARARRAGVRVIFVVLGFKPDYSDWPERSKILGFAKAAGALRLGSWGAALYPAIARDERDVIVAKNRVNIFHRTTLLDELGRRGIDRVLLGGSATDKAILVAAFAAHDHDYFVTVLEDLCIASSDEDHASGLKAIATIATIARSDDPAVWG